MEQLRIQLVDGRWTVNGRIYKEMSFLERDLLDKAITGLSKETIKILVQKEKQGH